MDNKIDKQYCISILVEILFERNLINQPTLLEIQKHLQNNSSHISQNQ